VTAAVVQPVAAVVQPVAAVVQPVAAVAVTVVQVCAPCTLELGTVLLQLTFESACVHLKDILSRVRPSLVKSLNMRSL
jgi:hypothetical protein